MAKVMFTWLKERWLRRKAQQQDGEHFAADEGSYIERMCIMGLMMATEAEPIKEQREQTTPEDQLTPEDKMIFMMGYECCMMWAIKSGIEKVLQPEEVNATVLAMQKHVAKHGWYKAGAFEKIWASMEIFMPIAMSQGPNAPPPFPIAEIMMALNDAGYPLYHMPHGLHFGVYVLRIIRELTSAAQSDATEHLQRVRRQAITQK